MCTYMFTHIVQIHEARLQLQLEGFNKNLCLHMDCGHMVFIKYITLFLLNGNGIPRHREIKYMSIRI